MIFTDCPCCCSSSSSSSSSSSPSFEKAKLTNHSTYEPEILHVNQFSSELVHIICSLTLLLLVKRVLTIHYNAGHIYVITDNPYEPRT